jgi:hypothetical protein
MEEPCYAAVGSQRERTVSYDFSQRYVTQTKGSASFKSYTLTNIVSGNGDNTRKELKMVVEWQVRWLGFSGSNFDIKRI